MIINPVFSDTSVIFEVAPHRNIFCLFIFILLERQYTLDLSIHLAKVVKTLSILLVGYLRTRTHIINLNPKANGKLPSERNRDSHNMGS